MKYQAKYLGNEVTVVFSDCHSDIRIVPVSGTTCPSSQKCAVKKHRQDCT